MAVRSWRMRVLLLPQDEISLDTLSTPPEIAAGANRVKKGIALEIGPLAIVGTGHAHGAYQHIWKTPLSMFPHTPAIRQRLSDGF